MGWLRDYVGKIEGVPKDVMEGIEKAMKEGAFAQVPDNIQQFQQEALKVLGKLKEYMGKDDKEEQKDPVQGLLMKLESEFGKDW